MSKEIESLIPHRSPFLFVDHILVANEKEDVAFLKGIFYGQEIKYVVKNIRVSNRLIKQSGVAYYKEVPITKATWVCARIG